MKHKIKHNIIFLHLPKNGGATLNAFLNRIYPANSVYQIRLKDSNTLTTQDFIDLPQSERSKIKVLKGHMYYGLHKYLLGTSEYITFLRHPEKRILSFYNFVQERPNHRLYQEVVGQKMNFSDFVEKMNTEDIHNAQIRYISGLPNADETTMLNVAKKNIEQHFAFVGLQEYYDESLVLLKKYYNWGIPYYTYKNKAHKPKVQNIIDTTTKNMILQKNAGDLELYAFIEEKLQRDLANSKHLAFELKKLSFANKLSNYRLGRYLLKSLNI
ncbi:MAG: sulfotransferase family 2 domain-containing protein [Gelidibacter sp.]